MTNPISIYDDGTQREIEIEPRTYAELPRVSDEIRAMEERWRAADKEIARLRDDPAAAAELEAALDLILRGLRDFTVAAAAHPLAAAQFTSRLSELGHQAVHEATYRSIHAQGVAARLKFPEGVR